MNVELLINGVSVDLAEVESVFNFGVNSFGDIASRRGTFSNQFTLPFTVTNNKLAEYFKYENANSQMAYSTLDFEILYYGNTCIKGIAQLLESNNDGYLIQCFSDNAEWSSLLKDLMIKEINPQFPVTCERYPWSISSCRNNDWTRGFIWPNANFGMIDNTMPPTQVIPATWLYPVFYLKFILKSIFDYIGYTPSGEAWNDPILSNIVMLPKAKTKLANTLDLTKDYYTDVQTTGQFPIPASGGGSFTIVPLNIVNADPSSSYNNTTYQYTASFPMSIAVEITATIDPTQYASLSGIISFAHLFVNGVAAPSAELYLGKLTTPMSNVRTGTFEVALNLGDTLDLRAGYAGVSIPPLLVEFEVRLVPQNVHQDGQPIEIGGVFDNWKATDFIAQWFNMYAINYTTNNYTKEINFFYSQNIVNNKLQATDVTNYIDYTTKPTIVPYYEDYGVNNILRYNLDEADVQLFGYDGRGNIQCGNLALDNEVEQWVSKCSLLVRRSFLQGSANLAVVPYDQGATEDITEKIAVLFQDNNRIIFNDNLIGSNPAIQWGLEVGTIDYEYLIPRYFGTVESILMKPKTISYATKLNYTNLRNFRWDRPVYIQDLGYFYANDITDVTLNESTTPILTLTRLN